jgi:putative sporulation protein YtaF
MYDSQLLIALLLAISCNLDNVGVGIAYGARGIDIPLASNLLIAFITAGGTLICIVFGQQVFRVLPTNHAVFLGAALLVAMGIWTIGQEFFKQRHQNQEAPSPRQANDLAGKSLMRRATLVLEDPALADRDSSGHIDVKESLSLSLALMLNNLPNGLGAGMLGLSALLITLCVGLLSILTFWLGIGIGRSLRPAGLGQWTGMLAGLLLIAIGVSQIIMTVPWRPS